MALLAKLTFFMGAAWIIKFYVIPYYVLPDELAGPVSDEQMYRRVTTATLVTIPTALECLDS